MHKTEHSHPQNTAILRIHTWCSSPTITEMKAPLEILFGMAERPAVAFFSIYSMDAKWWHQSTILSLWRSQKLQRTRSEEYSGWNSVLQEQLLICVGDVTKQITMVQHLTLFLLFWSSKPIYIRYQFQLLYLQSSQTELMSQLYELWPHLLFTTFYPSPPQSCTNGRSRIYATTE